MGLDMLHKHKIMHRDLKAANLVLKSKITSRSLPRDVCTKLADFGLCRQESRVACRYTSTVGTPEMLAPECLMGDQYGLPSDIFMFGLTIMQIFGISTDPDFCRTGDFGFNVECINSPEAKNLDQQVKLLIKQCCCNEPSKRLTSRDVVEILEELDKQVNNPIHQLRSPRF